MPRTIITPTFVACIVACACSGTARAPEEPTTSAAPAEPPDRYCSDLEVSEVVEGSPAERVGLRVGDVILSFDGEDVCSIDDLSSRATAGASSSGVRRLLVRRGEDRLTVEVPPGRVGMAVRERDRVESLRMPALREEILGMMAGVRQERDGTVELGELSPSSIARLEEIVSEHGWPRRSEIGAEGVLALLTLVAQAFDPELLRRCIEPVRAAFERGEVGGQPLAGLTDLLRVHEGRPQVYGTLLGPEGLEPLVEDREHLDERRRELGLPPLEEVLASFPNRATIAKPDLRLELLAMQAEVIAEGGQWVDPRASGNPRRTARLEEILREHGWPARSDVGIEGVAAMVGLVLRANDLELLRGSIAPIREAFERGEVDGEQLALLTDHTRSLEGRPQVYGTVLLANGQPAPIEDPGNVDERRRQLGLEPLEEYLSRLSSAMGQAPGQPASGAGAADAGRRR